MSNYRLNGTSGVRSFMRTNGIDRNLLPRLASAVNVPVIHLANENGQPLESFQRRINEAQTQSLADLLSTTVANLQTQNILMLLP